MNVHTVRVSFLREKQPKDFEKSTPAIEFSAEVQDGEDHAAVGRQLMRDAVGIAYNALGLEVPAPVAKKLGTAAAAEPAARAKKAEPKSKAQAQTAPQTESTRQISETPEDRRAPDDELPSDDLPADTGIPEEPEPKAEPKAKAPAGLTTAAELQVAMTVLVTERKITVAAIKEILLSFGAGRTSDLPADKIPEVWNAIQATVGA